MALQYGQYDFEKTTTALLSMSFWALSFAADMMAGDVGEPKKRRRSVCEKAMMGGCNEDDSEAESSSLM